MTETAPEYEAIEDAPEYEADQNEESFTQEPDLPEEEIVA